MPLETRLDGNPGAIRAAASYLRSDLGHGADHLATATYAQRSALASSWQGQAGDAFGTRAAALGAAADQLAAQGEACATVLDTLAAALRLAQDGFETIRSEARAAGLTVSGTLVLEPTAPPSPGPAPPFDATPAEQAAHESAVADTRAYQRLVVAWNHAVHETADRRDEWRTALEDAASTWNKHDSDLAGLANDLIVGGYDAALVAKLAPILSGEAAEQLTRARQLAAHADAMVRDGHFVGGDASRYYELLGDSKAAEARAAQYAALAKDPELPRGIKGGITGAGGVLSVLTTAWGIHNDLENGESTEQAVASNVGGTVAGIAAGTASGAAIGAAVGSVVPGAGTAVGAVGGAVVGTAVGVVTSGAIDSMYENGVDSAGDVVDAVGDGVDDLGDLAGDVGDVGGDVVDAIF
ncbi:MAG: hypothetical protein JWO76_3332 [Nocardioides sp.]|nr:hypothetical protein [Nocardioides sp.]